MNRNKKEQTVNSEIRKNKSIKINKVKMIRINQKINKAKLENLGLKLNQVDLMTENLRKFLSKEDHKKLVPLT